MKLQSVLLLGLVALMVGGTGAFLYHVRYHQKLGPSGVKLIPQPSYDTRGHIVASNSIFLPEKVLEYTSELPPIDDALLSWLPKDTTYGMRIYSSPDGFKIVVSVILMGADRSSIHKPEYCLPAQGWKIERTEFTDVAVAEPQAYTLPVVRILSSREGQLPTGAPISLAGVNIYWFVTRNKLATRHNEWMWSMMKHFLRTGELERWAYVMCNTKCLPGQEEAACERMKRFIGAAVPHFQLTAGPPAKLASTR